MAFDVDFSRFSGLRWRHSLAWHTAAQRMLAFGLSQRSRAQPGHAPASRRRTFLGGGRAVAAGKKRIGVIGVGFGLMVHVPGFRSEGWDVVALSSRSRERAQRAAQDAGIADIHTDPHELIRRNDIDAVAIATPPGPHHELSLAALKAGKHVLCEKPFAVNAKQAAEMRAAAEKSGKTAMVAHEFRHTPQRAYIKQLLDHGYIGQANLCTLELFVDRSSPPKAGPAPWSSKTSEGGGFLGALGSHYIDGLRFWFGDLERVSGKVTRLRPDLVDPKSGKPVKSETDDTFSFTAVFRSGVIASMTASFATSPTRGARIAVMGSEGTLYAEQPGANPMEDGVVLGSRLGAPLQKLDTPPQFTPFKDDRDNRLMAFRLLVRDFTRGIDTGSSPAPNFTDGWRCQQVLDAVRESSETGRSVKITG